MISDLNIKVNRDLCYACGICVDRCIMDNLRLYVAPCRTACPIDMNCQGYVRLIAQGKEKEAAEEMRKHLPFAGILGRVCHHPCEESCERSKIGDGAVHIRALKRYLAEKYPNVAAAPASIKKETGKKAAIVGSGPSGLMAAHDLRACGHQVTVFEAASAPGGLLRWAIPSFILPIAEVDAAVNMLADMGIQFITGKALGKDFQLADLERDYDAVLLAIGASESADLNIPGIEQKGVYQGLSLLNSIKENNLPDLGDSAIIIGGGNSAVDCALACKKLGVKDVRMVCLEDRNDMPAFEKELKMALEEGVIVENSCGPRQIIKKDTGKLGLETSRCISLFNDDGVFCPTLANECSLDLEADSIVIAIGLKLKSDGVPADLIQAGKGLKADPLTLQNPAGKKVFCCGDAVSGASFVVNAMGRGKEAAKSIDRFVSGDSLGWGRDSWTDNGYVKEYEAVHERSQGGARAILTCIPVEKRTLDTEIEITLTEEQAKQEAERCISCGRSAEVNQTCWICLPCEIDCPVQALEVRLPYQIR